MNKNSHKHKLWEFGTQCAQNVIDDLVLFQPPEEITKRIKCCFFVLQWLL